MCSPWLKSGELAEDVLFRLIYRGSQHQKKLKGNWYNACSVAFHLSDCFVTSLQYQRDLV